MPRQYSFWCMGKYLNGKRMDPGPQFMRQNAIDPAMLIDPRLALQGMGRNPNAKVAFPKGMATRMASMLMTLVNHLQK